MRDRLRFLFEFTAALAIVAILLGGLLYTADRALPVPRDVASLAGPAEIGDPVAPTPSNPAVPKTLDQLRAECVTEVRSQTAPRIGQASSCEQFARLSPRYVASGPARDSTLAPPRSLPAPQAEPGGREVSVLIIDCRPYGYGSIAYRQCRASEAKRLADKCSSYRAKLELAAFDRGKDTKAWYRAYCRASDSYRVID